MGAGHPDLRAELSQGVSDFLEARVLSLPLVSISPKQRLKEADGLLQKMNGKKPKNVFLWRLVVNFRLRLKIT